MKECAGCGNCYDDSTAACPVDSSALTSPFPGPPIVDGKYQLESCLGKGGMGAVYRARHLGLNRMFAVKIILSTRAGPLMAARFKREAEILGRLKHPNIVEVTDYGIDQRENGFPYLVMEYLNGSPLDRELRKTMSRQELLRLLDQVASGVDYAHERGILHRDLKPSNIFVVRDLTLREASVKILDFGLAKLTQYSSNSFSSSRIAGDYASGETSDLSFEDSSQELVPCGVDDGEHPSRLNTKSEELKHVGDSGSSGLTSAGHVMGTPAYLSPEQVRGGSVSKSADIYSLGVLVFQAFTGRLPFQGDTSKLLEQQINTPAPHPSSLGAFVPPEIGDAILTALSKEPGSRPGTASEYVQTLKDASLASEIRCWKKSEFLPRAWWTVGLATFAAVLCLVFSSLWPVKWLDARIAQVWMFLDPAAGADPRFLIVSIDESSLRSDPRPLASRGSDMGRICRSLLKAGAAGVAIDLLVPEDWGKSESMIGAVLEHPDKIVFSVYSTAQNKVRGSEISNGLITVAMGPERARHLFALANMNVDPDGVTRQINPEYTSPDGTSLLTLPMRGAELLKSSTAVQKDTKQWIDFRIAHDDYPRISWKDVESVLQQNPDRFRGRVVLIGAEFDASGDEDHVIPASAFHNRAVSGVQLTALAMDTIIRGFPVRQSGAAPVVALVLFFTIPVAFGILYGGKVRPALIAGLAAAGVIAVASCGVFLEWSLVLPVAAPILASVFASAVAIGLRWRLAPFPSR